MLQPMIVPDQGVGKRSPLTSWFRFASFSGPFQSQRKTRCSGVCKRGKGLVVLGRNLIPTQQMEILPRTANLERRGSWQIFKYVEELLWGCLGLGNQGYKELSPGFRAKMSDGSVAKAWQSSLVLSVCWLLHSWLTKIWNLIGWCRSNPWTRSYSNSFSECIFAKNVFFDLWNYANRDPRQVYIVRTCNFSHMYIAVKTLFWLLFAKQIRILKNAQGLDNEEARSKLLQSLVQESLEGPTSRLLRADPAKMAYRELPPGNWSSLYVLYQSHCLATNQEIAGRSTFYDCTLQWRKCMKFRKKSQHSTCLVCDRLKSEMRHATSFMEHAKFANRLLGHLAQTWKCREKYWEARSNSRAKADQLTLITDGYGYDKSKPCLPRWPHGRPPKGGAFDKCPRTGMQLSAVIAHGWGCAIYLAPEHVSCGGSYTWETLFHTMSLCWKQSVKEGRAYPRSLLGQVLIHCFELMKMNIILGLLIYITFD